MFNKTVVSFYIPGALTGAKDIYFTVPNDCTLRHVSAQCITQTATLQIFDDGVAITDDMTVAASTTPTEITKDEMLNDEYPQIRKDSVIMLDVGNGSNCVDLNLVLTFQDG